MSDFFTRMAELALETSRVVEPQTAPRFTQGPEVAPEAPHDSLWDDPPQGQPAPAGEDQTKDYLGRGTGGRR